MGIRNQLFSWGWISIYKAGIPVVSIGNLTVGGTGKTPLTDYCIKKMVQAGKRVMIVSRSYGGQVSKPCQVDPLNPRGGLVFGDEPFLLAQANPQASVFAGKSKWKTARYALSQAGQFDIMILDDGFQHRKLHRDLNILILDATEKFKNYRVVPEGRGRESWKGIERADIIVLTKSNLVDETSLAELHKILPADKPVFQFSYDIQTFKEINSRTAESSIQNFEQNSQYLLKSRDEFKNKKFLLVSAIATPIIFENMMKKMGEVSLNSLHFLDHHQYTEADLQQIKQAFEKSACDYIVTTEKDAVKLRPLLEKIKLENKSPFPSIWCAILEVSEFKNKGKLDECIQRLFA